MNVIYVFSKSLDDASSIGGGGVTVIQNPFDLPAERALSTFDRTHSFTGNWIYDLPFGDSRRFFNKGAISHVIGGWQWSGSYTIASGLYFTPRVLGATGDITGGVAKHPRECGGRAAVHCGEPDDEGVVQHLRVLQNRQFGLRGTDGLWRRGARHY